MKKLKYLLIGSMIIFNFSLVFGVGDEGSNKHASTTGKTPEEHARDNPLRISWLLPR